VRHRGLSRTTLSKAIAWVQEGPALPIFGTFDVWGVLSASKRRALVRRLCIVGAGVVTAVVQILTTGPWWTWILSAFVAAVELDGANDEIVAARDRRRDEPESHD
jgi:hypothetical protein